MYSGLRFATQQVNLLPASADMTYGLKKRLFKNLKCSSRQETHAYTETDLLSVGSLPKRPQRLSRSWTRRRGLLSDLLCECGEGPKNLDHPLLLPQTLLGSEIGTAAAGMGSDASPEGRGSACWATSSASKMHLTLHITKLNYVHRGNTGMV